MWIAGCADHKELQEWVADAGKFIQDREDTWVVFSDQIPLWVKIGMLKILYAEFNKVDLKIREKNQKVRKRRQKKLRASRGKDSQRPSPSRAEEPEDGEGEGERGEKRKASEMAGEGQSQKRGADASGDRCRIDAGLPLRPDKQ